MSVSVVAVQLVESEAYIVVMRLIIDCGTVEQTHSGTLRQVYSGTHSESHNTGVSLALIHHLTLRAQLCLKLADIFSRLALLTLSLLLLFFLATCCPGTAARVRHLKHVARRRVARAINTTIPKIKHIE